MISKTLDKLTQLKWMLLKARIWLYQATQEQKLDNSHQLPDRLKKTPHLDQWLWQGRSTLSWWLNQTNTWQDRCKAQIPTHGRSTMIPSHLKMTWRSPPHLPWRHLQVDSNHKSTPTIKPQCWSNHKRVTQKCNPLLGKHPPSNQTSSWTSRRTFWTRCKVTLTSSSLPSWEKTTIRPLSVLTTLSEWPLTWVICRDQQQIWCHMHQLRVTVANWSSTCTPCTHS